MEERTHKRMPNDQELAALVPAGRPTVHRGPSRTERRRRARGGFHKAVAAGAFGGQPSEGGRTRPVRKRKFDPAEHRRLYPRMHAYGFCTCDR